MATCQNLFCYWKVSEPLLFWKLTISRSWSVNDYWTAAYTLKFNIPKYAVLTSCLVKQ